MPDLVPFRIVIEGEYDIALHNLPFRHTQTPTVLLASELTDVLVQITEVTSNTRIDVTVGTEHAIVSLPQDEE